MAKYKRVEIRPLRPMVLHCFDVACYDYDGVERCSSRLEWRDMDDMVPENVITLNKSKLNKTHGDYCAIKF